MKHTTSRITPPRPRRIDARQLAGVPLRKPAVVAAPAVVDPLRVFSDCPRCAASGQNPRTYGPCLGCAGNCMIGCTCGHCEAGLVHRWDGTSSECPNARPATREEAAAYHEAWIASRGVAAPAPAFPLYAPGDEADIPF